MYAKGPIETYLDDLAARKPAPGGGSAAALQAAMAAALISMVANYTIDNLKYKSGENKAKEILKKSEAARKRLVALLDEDIEAYGKLTKTMNEYPENETKMDTACKEATNPPFEICRISAECLRLCGELAECGNKSLVTDTAIAALFLEGAFFASKYNVYINLKYIKDMDFIAGIHKVLQPLEEELPKLKEEILEKCEEVIR